MNVIEIRPTYDEKYLENVIEKTARITKRIESNLVLGLKLAL